MLLEENTIELKWSNVNKKRYAALGYSFTKNGERFYPKVKDVLKCSSGVKIPVICDYCGEIFYPTTTNYLKLNNTTPSLTSSRFTYIVYHIFFCFSIQKIHLYLRDVSLVILCCFFIICYNFFLSYSSLLFLF